MYLTVLGFFLRNWQVSMSTDWLLCWGTSPVCLGMQGECWSPNLKLHFRRSWQKARERTLPKGEGARPWVSEGILSSPELDACESKVWKINISISWTCWDSGTFTLRPLWETTTRGKRILPFCQSLQHQLLRVKAADSPEIHLLTAMGPGSDYSVFLYPSLLISKMGVKN